MFESRRSLGVLVAVVFVFAAMLSGCGNKQAGGARPTAVKAMNVLRQDTPLTHVYAGQIMGTDEVQIRSRVSGNIVEKYIVGGQFVRRGSRSIALIPASMRVLSFRHRRFLPNPRRR